MNSKEQVLSLIDNYWKFDKEQQPASSWHDKNDLLEKVSEVLSITPSTSLFNVPPTHRTVPQQLSRGKEEILKKHMRDAASKEGITSDEFDKSWDAGKEQDPEILPVILSAMTEYRSIGERDAREQTVNELVGWMEEKKEYKHPFYKNAIINCIHKAKSLLNQQGEEKCDAMGHFGGAKPEGICGKCNKKW